VISLIVLTVAAASPSGATISPEAEAAVMETLREAEEAASAALLAVYTQGEIDYCASSSSGQPFLFCLADRRYERGEYELETLLPKLRAAARAQSEHIAEFSRRIGGVTLEGDPVDALETSQRLWKESAAADCLAFGLSQATGDAGTQGVETELDCRADRVFERIEYLKLTYDIED
jgi:hypothetical protein